MEPRDHPWTIGAAGLAARNFSDWIRAKLDRFAGRAFSFARHKARLLGRVCRQRLQGAAEELVHSADEWQGRRQARRQGRDHAKSNTEE